jgi:hypothetical protein
MAAYLPDMRETSRVQHLSTSRRTRVMSAVSGVLMRRLPNYEPTICGTIAFILLWIAANVAWGIVGVVEWIGRMWRGK